MAHGELDDFVKKVVEKSNFSLQDHPGELWRLLDTFPFYQGFEEFDAYGSELSTIMLHMRCTQENINVLDKWIRSGGIVKDTPNCLEEWKWVLAIWFCNKILYKRFLNRMSGLLVWMDEKLNPKRVVQIYEEGRFLKKFLQKRSS
jgi:hypothetical protein